MANPDKTNDNLGKADKTAMRIPLSSILIRDDWNARSGGWKSQSEVVDGEPKEGADGELGLAGLTQSLAFKGQDTPIQVRLHPKGSTKTPYELVAGFRRMEALRRLAEKGVMIPGWTDVKEPTVLAIVKTLTDAEARALNIRENVERENLSIADIAWSIQELKKDNPTATDLEISRMIGKSNGYVSKLARIWAGTKPSILAQWRSMPKGTDSLSLEKRLALIDVPAAEQEEAYRKLTETKPTATNNWMDKSSAQAKKIGFLIGTLEREGKIDTTNLDFEKDIKLLVAGGIMNVHGKAEEGATEKQWATLAESAEAGWKEGMTPPAPAETKTDEKAKGNGKAAAAEAAPAQN